MTSLLENVEDVYPLTPMQAGMLFHSISEPGIGVFIDQICSVLVGDLDVPRFKRAWDRLARRHAVLRTAFLWDGLDEPLQVVRQDTSIAWVELDWTAHDHPERATRLEAILREDRRRDFELADAPLLRMALARESASEWRWIFTFHHLVLDGWSVSLLLREVLEIYDGLGRGGDVALAPSFRYRDFIAWQLRQDEARAEQHWRTTLRGFERPTRPPASGNTTSRGVGRCQHLHTLSAVATDKIRSMAVAHRVTLSVVVQAAWALLLGKWAGERDVVFGVTVAGRPPTLPEIERAVGLFINTLPLRVDIDPEARLGDWFRALQGQVSEMRDFEYSSLAAVQRRSEVQTGVPVFETIVVFENYPHGTQLSAEGLEIRDVEFHEQSNYPLAWLALPGPELSLTLVYDTARFERDTIVSLAHRLASLLERFADSPDQRLGDIPLLDADEQRRILIEWNRTDAPVPSRKLIHELIEDSAREKPGAVAVVFEQQRLTYAELDQAANRLAHRLREHGVGPDVRVGLFVERSLDLPIGILGILKAGGAYVPLDPSYPTEHLRLLLEESEPQVVLAPTPLFASLPPTRATLVALDADDGLTCQQAPISPPEAPTTGEDLAYVIFTSGSTGRPKGVMITHRNLVHSTAARDRFYSAPVGRFLLLSSFSFDSSVAGIFWSLCTGGTLVIPRARLELDLARLLELVRTEDVTHLLCLPTLYGLLLENSTAGQLDSLTTAVVAGEACTTALVRRHFETLPGCGLYNEYGPTEATVWATAHRVTPADRHGAVPIGTPIANTRAYVLDGARQPVPTGFVGELYLAGSGLARGYLADEALTARKFAVVPVAGRGSERMYRTGDLVRRRDNGDIEFLGRADAQLKIRGHRVEVTAVESGLLEQENVADAVVVGWDGNRDDSGRTPVGRMRLVGYVTPVTPSVLNPESLRSALAKTMPAFMVPDVIMVVDTIPRQPNGKTDYRRLPSPSGSDGASGAAASPRTPTEHALAEIWSVLLGIDSIGVHDNFFQLGGDSIVTIQVISRARQRGLEISPRHVTDHPTIAELAAVVDLAGTRAARLDVATGTTPLTPIQAWFFGLGLVAPQHWNQSALFEVPADIDARALKEAWQECVDHHDILRARFRLEDGAWRQEIMPRAAEHADLDVVDSGADPGEDDESAVAALIATAQSTLDLSEGPLARAVLIRRGGSRRPRLLIAIHHLLIDVVSWSILMDDLDTAYRQRFEGQEVDLPTKTTSYRRWAERLAEHAGSNELAQERAYWVDRPVTCDIPLDTGPADGATEATAQTVVCAIAEHTGSLLSEIHEVYRTRIEDFITLAVARAVGRWLGRDTVRLELEGHGRPDDLPCIDLSRTVGWFTASYPVTLDTHAHDIGLAIKEAKETLRAVPAGGVGYGVLRHLSEGGAGLATQAPQIVLNYLGRLRSPPEGAIFARVSGVEGSSRDPRNARTHPLEVIAALRDDRLVVEWIYSEALHRRDTIERLASWFEEELEAMIDHCRSEDAGGFTPSDFPDADLDQGELDRFFESLGDE
jgi:amino acid adenylation domain-containing protein/non-ribosomal peptide synthase protein (TIGR01720 family)